MCLQESKQETRKTQKDGMAEGPNTEAASGVYLKVECEWGVRRLSYLGFYCYDKTSWPKAT